MSRRHDVCLVGHVTRDRIRIGDQLREQPGGAAYYAALTLCRLGRSVSVLTKMARRDERFLLEELRAEKIDITCIDSASTTTFENSYPEGRLDGQRVQRLDAVAAAFSPGDLGGLRAGFFQLGPLTADEMSLEFLRAVSERGDVCLDVQGLVRRLNGKEVETQAWADLEEGLGAVSILKANREEAEVLSGEPDPERAVRRLARLVGRGAREAVVTLGSRGAVICSADRLYHIPPAAASDVIDVTGCGDTFIAAYLHRRLGSEDVDEAGRFASAVASLALAQFGPFDATEREVEAMLASNPHLSTR